MSISRLTKLVGLTSVLLSFLTVGMVLIMNRSIDREREFTHQQLRFRQLGYELAQASDFLTREARRYTIFGDRRHYDAYWTEVTETRTRDQLVETLRGL